MTPVQTLELVKLLSAYCLPRGIVPGEAIANILNTLNRLERGAHGADPTGFLRPTHYPHGKPLNPDDGGMGMARVEKRADGIVYIVLGKMVVNWIALTPDLARDLARTLTEVADGPADLDLPAGKPPAYAKEAR